MRAVFASMSEAYNIHQRRSEKKAVALNSLLASSAKATQEFAQNPLVSVSLEDFTQTLQLANPIVAGLAPAQAFCNYLLSLIHI